ncbi:zinc-dependent peptidase [Flavobacteriaceae bacterium TP-CH-4]|uniref:Zinc-dependent peptidase n=1 Tax=Pelagihabitans pacificus TaxID=2696054 RepID=A0A967ARK0_9FLAO|nr:zinc-dependent peptidase [Pelagihabitans pacificus]NHF58190.1 zinc-dependent peptidase [Pelagihabitans pacificus]
MVAPKIFAILAGLYIIGYVLYIIYYAVGLYQFNPFVKLKPLTRQEQAFLTENFPIYGRLPLELRERCEKRIVWFRSRKKFVFYGKVARRADVPLLLSGTAVLMTMGLKNYQMRRSLLRLIVYPSRYYSRINKRHHFGEYNPRLKTLIFSAEQLWKGFEVPHDNVNLAVHEFAHALIFEMYKKRTWEARKFRVGLHKIKELFLLEGFVDRLETTQYFREYGMTNLQEFFSVAVEHYVETPEKFYEDFPELYALIKGMLKFEFRPLDTNNGKKAAPGGAAF